MFSGGIEQIDGDQQKKRGFPDEKPLE